MVYNCTEFALARLYSDRCLLCRGRATTLPLCPACRLALPINTHACPVCAAPLPADNKTNLPCGQCLRVPPGFDRVYAPFLYLSPVDRLISDFKFSGQLAIGRLLSQLLHATITPAQLDTQLLIPMPLHPSRLRQRGYNQALELARPLARASGIPILTGCCKRVKATSPQAGLDKQSRRKNMQGAFVVVDTINASHVTIIDDVLTTGSSASALARVIKQTGVQRVDVWSVARTP